MKKNTIKDVFTELRLIHWMFSVKRKKHFSQDHLLFHKINTLLFFTPPPLPSTYMTNIYWKSNEVLFITD